MMRKIDMNLSDFYRNDFQESFKVNDNHEVLTEFNDDYSLITIDNFFKYPDQVVDVVKRFPVNDKTKYYEKLKEENPDYIVPAGEHQVIPSEFLSGVSAVLYNILSEYELIPFSFNTKDKFQQLNEQVAKFAWYTDIFYPRMKNISNTWNPGFKPSKFNFNISLGQYDSDECTSGLSLYNLVHDDKEYSSVDDILKIDDLETKSDIRDRLNDMHKITEDSPEFYEVKDTDLFKECRKVSFIHNRLIFYKGSQWHSTNYNSAKEKDIHYSLCSAYTPEFQQSEFE